MRRFFCPVFARNAKYRLFGSVFLCYNMNRNTTNASPNRRPEECMKKWIGLFLAGLLLFSAIGCAPDRPSAGDQAEPRPVSSDRGAPDQVMSNFLCQYVIESDSNEYSYHAKHDTYAVEKDGEEYILDYVDFDIIEYKDSGEYSMQSNVIFLGRPDGTWGWNNVSFTRAEKIEKNAISASDPTDQQETGTIRKTRSRISAVRHLFPTCRRTGARPQRAPPSGSRPRRRGLSPARKSGPHGAC